MAEITYKMIGDRIREARSTCGYTQQQLADFIGTKRESISYFENGQRPIDMIMLEKIADLCGYSITYFIVPDNSHETQEVLAAFRTQELCADDLEVVAWAKRLAKNLNALNRMLNK